MRFGTVKAEIAEFHVADKGHHRVVEFEVGVKVELDFPRGAGLNQVIHFLADVGGVGVGVDEFRDGEKFRHEENGDEQNFGQKEADINNIALDFFKFTGFRVVGGGGVCSPSSHK